MFNDGDENEFKLGIISNFEIRKRTIVYFTYHVVKNLIHFNDDHYKLLNLIEKCIDETTDKNLSRVKSKAETMLDYNKTYLLEYTQHMLNNTSIP